MDDDCLNFYGECHPESYDPGNKIWDGIPSTSYPPTITLDNMAQGTDLHYSIGNYYNWTAVVALNDSSMYGYNYSSYDTIDQSICPAGWTLPGGGYSSSYHPKYRNLLSYYDWDGWTIPNIDPWQTPFYFTLSGAWVGDIDNENYSNISYDGSIYEDSIKGCPDRFTFSSGGDIYMSECDDYRMVGRPVRCVARNISP